MGLLISRYLLSGDETLHSEAVRKEVVVLYQRQKSDWCARVRWSEGSASD
jgi:hypothetical protein